MPASHRYPTPFCEQGVQGVQVEHDTSTNEARWDDLRLLLDVIDGGSFRRAAATNHVSVNTVRARIERLERQIGSPLVVRSVQGIRPTASGARLRLSALAMRSRAPATTGSAVHDMLVSPGELRIGASEALGSGWLTPHLIELQASFPELTVSLLCENDIETDRSADLDVGIVWQPPRDGNLIMSRLATLHFMPFASRDYISKHGVPSSIDDLLYHRFIEQVAPGVRSSLLDQLVGTDRPQGFLPIRTNSSLALFWAVTSGAGIAFMPTYALGVTRRIVPIDLPFQLKFDIFCHHRAAARDDPAVRKTVEWLRRLFDPVVYPWFAREFVHPAHFPQRQGHGNVVRLFEPLLGNDGPP